MSNLIEITINAESLELSAEQIVCPGHVPRLTTDDNIDHVQDKVVARDDAQNIFDAWTPPYNHECPCCLEVPVAGKILLGCNHLLCIECFVKHIPRSKECPICRNDMFTTRLIMPSIYQQPDRARPLTTRQPRGRPMRVDTLAQFLSRSPAERQQIIDNRARQRTTTQLRNAPPLRAARTSNGRIPIYNENYTRHDHDDDYSDEDSEYFIPVSVRQSIIVMVFIVTDIALTIGWLYMLHKNNKTSG